MKSVDQVRAAKDAGWAAVSLKFTFDPAPYVNLPPRYRWLRRSRLHIFTAETRLGPSQGLKLMEEARKATTDMLVLPNIAHDGDEVEGWRRLAKRFENAGTRPSETTLRPCRSPRGASTRTVRLGQAEPRRMGKADQKGLRRGRAPLRSLSPPHEDHRRHHRSRAGAQDPHAPRADTEASPRPGSHLPPLIAPLLRPGGSLSPRLHRNATEPAGGGPRPAACPDTPLLDGFGR